jgi:hypothetical protein
MIKFFARWLARRRWAHIRACYQFGRRSAHITEFWVRRRKYDALFNEYMRIARVMQAHGHHLD